MVVYHRGPGYFRVVMNKKNASVVLNAPECDWLNAHVTILFLGKVTDYRETMRDEILDILNSSFKDVVVGAYAVGNGSWKVSNKFTAFPVVSDKLENLYSRLARWLEPIGARNASKFTFNPHITAPNDKDIPIYFELWPLQLWWGGVSHDIV